MITIISGTNRPDNFTMKVAKIYEQLLQEKGEHPVLLTMEDLSPDFLHPEMYSTHGEKFKKIQDEIIDKTEKFIFIVPEYNGSIPGILKMFIDASDVKKFYHKKAALTGVASGRAGNLRGMDHLTDILHHIKVTVMPNKLPISRIEEELSEAGQFIKPQTVKVINQQIDEFINF